MTGLSISQPSLSAVSVLCGWQACILLSGETRVMSGRSSHALHALNVQRNGYQNGEFNTNADKHHGILWCLYSIQHLYTNGTIT